MMFYYEVYEQEFDDAKSTGVRTRAIGHFPTNIRSPEKKTLAGFDVVTSVTRNSPECSPFSCNSLANEIQTNSHCLVPIFETTKQLVEMGMFNNSEPGPYRIFAVYTLE